MSYFLIYLTLFSTIALSLEEFDREVINEYMKEDLSSYHLRGKQNVYNLPKIQNNVLSFKGQKLSQVRWSEIKEHEWLDVKRWVKLRERKDDDALWLESLVNSPHYELIGMVMKCVGECNNYTKSSRVKSEFLSKLYEGDEHTTGKDSYSWIYLIDGSLIRLSPDSSITVQEINFTKNKQVVIIRLNNGLIHYIPRSKIESKVSKLEESDALFLPLQFKTANRTWFKIQSYKNLTNLERVQYVTQKTPGEKEQVKYLNELIKENNKVLKERKTHFFIFTPNYTLEGDSGVLTMYYSPNGEGQFKISSINNSEQNTSILLGLRGYNNTSREAPDFNKWYKVSRDGQSFNEINGNKILGISNLFINRIPSLLIGRELLIKKHLIPMLSSEYDLENYAKNFGYRAWDVVESDETKKRLNFVREYVRRVETTNLRSLKKLLGNKETGKIDRALIQRAFNAYYKNVKSRYSPQRQKLYNLNDTQYYLWMLRNGK